MTTRKKIYTLFIFLVFTGSSCDVENATFDLSNRCGQPGVSAQPSQFFNNLFGDNLNQLSRGNITGSYLDRDGQRLWFVNDCFVNTPSGELMIRNAIVIEKDGTFKSVFGGTVDHPTALIESEEDSWASINKGSLQNGVIELVATVSETTGEGAFDFQIAGTLLVRLDANTLVIETMEERNAFAVLWGSALFYDANYAYIYGTRNRDYGKEVFLARSSGNSILDQWTYYDGYVWSQNPEDARPISNVLSKASDYFSIWNAGGRYFLVSQSGLFGEEVNLYSSDKLERDWRLDQILYCRSSRDENISFSTIVNYADEHVLECSYSLIDRNLSDFSIRGNEFVTIRNWKP
jgi:hypothetical protein